MLASSATRQSLRRVRLHRHDPGHRLGRGKQSGRSLVLARRLRGAPLLALLPAVTALPFLFTPCSEGEGSLHDHTLPLLDASTNVSLSEYAGKVVLLVNVATY